MGHTHYFIDTTYYIYIKHHVLFFLPPVSWVLLPLLYSAEIDAQILNNPLKVMLSSRS